MTGSQLEHLLTGEKASIVVMDTQVSEGMVSSEEGCVGSCPLLKKLPSKPAQSHFSLE